MNVNHASDLHGVFQILARQRALLEHAKSRQGQRPRDRKSRDELYTEFMLQQLLHETAVKPENVTMHSSMIPFAYQPCIKPISGLKPISIDQLQVETHHRGRYVLLRSITPPSRMTAVMVIVEDKDGDTTLLQLYHQEPESKRKTTDVVDVGSVLLIKEPYFKVTADGGYSVRVDHMSDAVHLEHDDPMVPQEWQSRPVKLQETAEQLRLCGNMAFREKKYWKAIAEYSKALKLPTTTSEIEMILRNRSLAYLRTEQFDAALADTGYPDFHSNTSEKSLFRAAEALRGLRRYSDCGEVLQKLCELLPTNEQASNMLTSARSRIHEQNTGEFDFQRLQREVKTARPPTLDVATYIGPVQVEQTQSKGRGLFVTKGVKAGDLLLCEKAFEHVYVPDAAEQRESQPSLLINIETNSNFFGAHASLLTALVQKLYRNPSLAHTFTQLHCGSYETAAPASVDAGPVVDTFLVERIMSLNIFGYPLTSKALHDEVRRCKEVKEDVHHSCGIWTLASHINHSCVANARRSFIGDMMIVRAACDIEQGAEIVFPYALPATGEIGEMRSKLIHWGFTCDCAVCADNKATKAPALEKRRKLRREVETAFNHPQGADPRKIEKTLVAMEGTYVPPAHEVPRLLLWASRLALAHLYFERQNAVKFLEAAERALTSIGFLVEGAKMSSPTFKIVKWGLPRNRVVGLLVRIQATFAVNGAKESAAAAGRYARVAYRIIVGEDATFEELYG